MKLLNFRRELQFIRKRFFLRGMYSTAYSSLSKLVPFLTILWYIESDEGFNKSKVFFMVACFNSMIQSTAYTFPLAVSSTGELLVSIRRIDVREKKNH